MLILINSEGADATGFVGDIDEIAIFQETLTPYQVAAHYAVGKYAPNEYVELMKFDDAEGIYSFDHIDNFVYGLYWDGTEYVDLKYSMRAACAESTAFALNPTKNSIALIIMDVDGAPRDQIAVQNDTQLDGDEQLVPGNTPYQGLCQLEWDNEEATLSFLTLASEHEWSFSMVPNRLHTIRLQFDGAMGGIKVVQSAYEDNGDWIPESTVFDTGRFPLDFRLRGGVGWQAELTDHASRIERIYLEEVEYAEYRSTPLRSRMPYAGAQVFKSGTPPFEVVEFFAASDWGGAIDHDPMKSTSGKAYKVTTSAENRFEGIRSQRFFIQNPGDIRVSARVLSGVNLELFLYCYETDVMTSIHQHDTLGPDWTEIDKTISLPEAGHYALYVTSAYFGEWWVDNLSVRPPSVAWAARPDRESPWAPLKSAVADSEYGGVVFEFPGKELQVRGASKTIDGNVYDLQIKPKYAELGKLIWRDEV